MTLFFRGSVFLFSPLRPSVLQFPFLNGYGLFLFWHHNNKKARVDHTSGIFCVYVHVV
jgi:hypothetical protein